MNSNKGSNNFENTDIKNHWNGSIKPQQYFKNLKTFFVTPNGQEKTCTSSLSPNDLSYNFPYIRNRSRSISYTTTTTTNVLKNELFRSFSSRCLTKGLNKKLFEEETSSSLAAGTEEVVEHNNFSIDVMNNNNKSSHVIMLPSESNNNQKIIKQEYPSLQQISKNLSQNYISDVETNNVYELQHSLEDNSKIPNVLEEPCYYTPSPPLVLNKPLSCKTHFPNENTTQCCLPLTETSIHNYYNDNNNNNILNGSSSLHHNQKNTTTEPINQHYGDGVGDDSIKKHNQFSNTSNTTTTACSNELKHDTNIPFKKNQLLLTCNNPTTTLLNNNKHQHDDDDVLKHMNDNNNNDKIYLKDKNNQNDSIQSPIIISPTTTTSRDIFTLNHNTHYLLHIKQIVFGQNQTSLIIHTQIRLLDISNTTNWILPSSSSSSENIITQKGFLENIQSLQTVIYQSLHTHTTPWNFQLAVQKSLIIATILSQCSCPKELPITPILFHTFNNNPINLDHLYIFMKKVALNITYQSQKSGFIITGFLWHPFEFGSSIIINRNKGSIILIPNLEPTFLSATETLATTLNILRNPNDYTSTSDTEYNLLIQEALRFDSQLLSAEEIIKLCKLWLYEFGVEPLNPHYILTTKLRLQDDKSIKSMEFSIQLRLSPLSFCPQVIIKSIKNPELKKKFRLRPLGYSYSYLGTNAGHTWLTPILSAAPGFYSINEVRRSFVESCWILRKLYLMHLHFDKNILMNPNILAQSSSSLENGAISSLQESYDSTINKSISSNSNNNHDFYNNLSSLKKPSKNEEENKENHYPINTIPGISIIQPLFKKQQQQNNELHHTMNNNDISSSSSSSIPIPSNNLNNNNSSSVPTTSQHIPSLLQHDDILKEQQEHFQKNVCDIQEESTLSPDDILFDMKQKKRSSWDSLLQIPYTSIENNRYNENNKIDDDNNIEERLLLLFNSTKDDNNNKIHMFDEDSLLVESDLESSDDETFLSRQLSTRSVLTYVSQSSADRFQKDPLGSHRSSFQSTLSGVCKFPRLGQRLSLCSSSILSGVGDLPSCREVEKEIDDDDDLNEEQPFQEKNDNNNRNCLYPMMPYKSVLLHNYNNNNNKPFLKQYKKDSNKEQKDKEEEEEEIESLFTSSSSDDDDVIVKSCVSNKKEEKEHYNHLVEEEEEEVESLYIIESQSENEEHWDSIQHEESCDSMDKKIRLGNEKEMNHPEYKKRHIDSISNNDHSSLSINNLGIRHHDSNRSSSSSSSHNLSLDSNNHSIDKDQRQTIYQGLNEFLISLNNNNNNSMNHATILTGSLDSNNNQQSLFTSSNSSSSSNHSDDDDDMIESLTQFSIIDNNDSISTDSPNLSYSFIRQSNSHDNSLDHCNDNHDNDLLLNEYQRFDTEMSSQSSLTAEEKNQDNMFCLTSVSTTDIDHQNSPLENKLKHYSKKIHIPTFPNIEEWYWKTPNEQDDYITGGVIEERECINDVDDHYDNDDVIVEQVVPSPQPFKARKRIKSSSIQDNNNNNKICGNQNIEEEEANNNQNIKEERPVSDDALWPEEITEQIYKKSQLKKRKKKKLHSLLNINPNTAIKIYVVPNPLDSFKPLIMSEPIIKTIIPPPLVH